MLSKTETYTIWKTGLTISGKEPFLSHKNQKVTVQLNFGHSAHQLASLSPALFPTLRKDERLEIAIVQKTETKTWLGKLWEYFNA